MREIKFRIWADNQFYYKCLVGNTNNTTDDNWTCPMVWLKDKKEWVNCDNGIICEYTGLRDKNGVEIYEGDIVEYKYIGEDGEPKEYMPKRKVMNFKNNGWHLGSKWLDGYTMNNFELKVIGNIYENPDLVGGELC